MARDGRHDGDHISHYDARFTGTFDVDYDIGTKLEHGDEFALFVRARVSKENYGEMKNGGIKRTNVLTVIHATPLEGEFASKIEQALSPYSQMTFDDVMPNTPYYEELNDAIVQETDNESQFVDITDEVDQMLHEHTSFNEIKLERRPNARPVEELVENIANAFGVDETDIFSPGGNEHSGPKLVHFEVDSEVAPGAQSTRSKLLEDFLNE